MSELPLYATNFGFSKKRIWQVFRCPPVNQKTFLIGHGWTRPRQLPLRSCIETSKLISIISSMVRRDGTLPNIDRNSTSITISIDENGICIITNPITHLLPSMATIYVWNFLIDCLKLKNVQYAIYCPWAMILHRFAHLSNLTPMNFPWPSQTSSSGFPAALTWLRAKSHNSWVKSDSLSSFYIPFISLSASRAILWPYPSCKSLSSSVQSSTSMPQSILSP